MKAWIVAAATATLVRGAGASAHDHDLHHNHKKDLFCPKRADANANANQSSTPCEPSCTTYVTTLTGPIGHSRRANRTDAVVYTPPPGPPTGNATSSAQVSPTPEPGTSTTSSAVLPTSPPQVQVPVPPNNAPPPGQAGDAQDQSGNTGNTGSQANKPNGGSGTGSWGLGASDGMWAITYNPYTEQGLCKTADEVMTDIQSIKATGFSTVRVYSTDCETLPHVGAAAKATGLKMIIGIFLNEAGCANSSHVSDQTQATLQWAQWDLVSLVVVGNEALWHGYCNPGQLANLISSVKTSYKEAGYNGPFTTTDVVSSWLGNDMSPVCAVIDVVACNAHAYFSADTTCDMAGDFVAGQLALVETVCPGKVGYVLETGWPSKGNDNGKAVASQKAQSIALASIKEKIGNRAVFFTFGLDLWKPPGACNCEAWFDCKGFWASLASK